MAPSPILYPAEAMGHVPMAPTLEAFERRLVLTLLRMVWRDAKAARQHHRMESTARLGKAIRFSQLGDRFVQ